MKNLPANIPYPHENKDIGKWGGASPSYAGLIVSSRAGSVTAPIFAA